MRKFRDPKRYGRLDLAKHCFIHKGRYADFFSWYFGKEGALKVFDLVPIRYSGDLHSVKWGDDPDHGTPRKNTTLWEATQIQNILSWYGLAPRVYGLDAVEINNKLFPVQFIEFLEYEEDKVLTQAEVNKVIDQCDQVGRKYGFSKEVNIASPADIINGKLVDPQFYAFDKPYQYTVHNIYRTNKYGKFYYQDVPELGLESGPRKSKQREIDLGLDRIDFKDKTVVDIGCAGGYFTRAAVDRGAKLADGLDELTQIESARNVANFLGYFNNSYYVVDLLKDKWHINYDIVFFLSLNYHIGIPQQVLDAPMVIFEDNSKETRNITTLGKPWTDHFSRIEFIGEASDHGRKSIYHLYK
jgi:hypothetical protein